jgi:ferrochelatase
MHAPCRTALHFVGEGERARGGIVAFTRVGSRRIGVLIVNLGTPEATDYWSMRRYLKEFLSDRRVIEESRWIWWPVLNGIILSTRPGRRGKDYATIWNKELNESPLKTITRGQAEKLMEWIAKGGLGEAGCDIAVEWAMRYGEPSLAARIQALRDQGCDQLLIVPLYPQYSAATTATVCDKVFAVLSQMRRQPTLRVAPPYYDDPAYIGAVARSIRAELDKLEFEPEVILASFHGTPQDQLTLGDPYYRHCVETTRLLREALELPAEKFVLTFQSRFGRAEWLKPYTDATVIELAKSGVKRLAIVTPGFAADCLETIEEIGVENAGYFHANGGEKFVRVPCLNDSEAGTNVIKAIVTRELAGWV